MRYYVVAVLLAGGLSYSLLADCEPQLKAAPAPTAVSIDTATAMLEKVKNQDLVLIDVRSPEEYAEGHIPGAINMPHDQIEQYVSQLDDIRDKPILIYCRSGRRAKLALEDLKARSFADVSHLEGDMMGWNGAGLPVARM